MKIEKLNEIMDKAAPSFYLCPLTHCLLKDPVITESGSTFERKAIEKWLKKNNKDPLTNQEINPTLIPNRILRDVIEEWKCNNIVSFDSQLNASSSANNTTKKDTVSRVESAAKKDRSNTANNAIAPMESKIEDAIDSPKKIYAVICQLVKAITRSESHQFSFKIFDENGDLGAYIGQFNKRGSRNGKGMMMWEDGSVYSGSFKNDKCEGKGILFSKGSIYKGEFKEQKFQGNGILKSADGNVYRGEFVNFKKHGKGKIWYANGDKYEGSFKNDKLEGKGVFKYSNGDVYRGSFKNDERDGTGTLSNRNDGIHIGLFKANKKEGIGKICYYNGSTFEGDFKNNEKNGYGTFTHHDGTLDIIPYEAGIAKGEGVRWSNNGKRVQYLKDGECMEEITISKAATILAHIGILKPYASASDVIM